MKSYYSQAALAGFGLAVAQKLDLKVAFTTGEPRTNGKTIYLPEIAGHIDADEFAALCGITIHECSHVYFGSCELMKTFATTTGADQQLRANCFNAVLDVTDETRMEHVISSARALFIRSNYSCHQKILDAKAMDPGSRDPVWQVLAAAILFTRIGACKLYRDLRSSGHPHFALMGKAYKILRTCKTAKFNPHQYRHHRNLRKNQQWNKLFAAAEQLVDLLKQAGIGQGEAQPNGQPFGPMGAGEDMTVIARGRVLSPEQIAGGRVATFDEGAEVADPPDPSSPLAPAQAPAAPAPAAKPAPARPGWGAGSGTQKPPAPPTNFDEGLYRTLAPVLNGVVERMARSDDADGISSGWSSGPRLGQIERASIDGMCFARRNSEGERIHVAILMDTSGSMESKNPDKAMAVAQAFADAMKRVAQTTVMAQFDSYVVPVQSFRDLEINGSTNTHTALNWADGQISSKPGKRVIVCITDGDPGNTGLCKQSCENTRHKGVQIIGISYMFSPAGIAKTMPGALVVGAKNPCELAVQLSRIAQQIGTVSR